MFAFLHCRFDLSEGKSWDLNSPTVGRSIETATCSCADSECMHNCASIMSRSWSVLRVLMFDFIVVQLISFLISTGAVILICSSVMF